MLITVPITTAVTLKSLISTQNAITISNQSAGKFNVILQNLGANNVYFDEGWVVATVASGIQLVAGSGGAALTAYELSKISLIAETAPTDIRVSISAVI